MQWYSSLVSSDTTQHTLKFGKDVYLDGSLIHTFSYNSSATTFDEELFMFAINDYGNGGAKDFCNMKLYSFKITDTNDDLVRDFVPCYRTNDSVI